MKPPWKIISVFVYMLLFLISVSQLCCIVLVLGSFLLIHVCFIIFCFIAKFIFFLSTSFPSLEVNAVSSFPRLLLCRSAPSWEHS